MLVLFIGWGIFFIVSLVKFRASKNKKANYKGVESHYSSVLEATVAVIEIAFYLDSHFLYGLSVLMMYQIRETQKLQRVIAQQYTWNIHYPGPDGRFGATRIDLVDEQDKPIGLDRSSEFAEDDFTTINQLHIPVNRKIRVDLSSKM